MPDCLRAGEGSGYSRKKVGFVLDMTGFIHY
jgi:hypothetical protein